MPSIYDRATQPLTDAPSRLAKKASPSIDAPRMGSQMFDPNSFLGGVENFGNRADATMRGFGAGALEGAGDYLSGMTSPLSLATMVAGPAMSAIGKFGNAARGLGPSIQMLEEAPAIRQAMPSVDDVGSLIGDMQRNLARIPNARGVAPSANLPAEMIPRGLEASYNSPRLATAAQSVNSLDDVAQAGSMAANKMRMPIGGNIDVAGLMQQLNRARGR